MANSADPYQLASSEAWWWLGVTKVSSIFCYRGVQLILAFSWARLAILVAGNGRGECFLFLLFLPFHSYSSFFPVPRFHLLYCLFYLFSPFLWETTQYDRQGLTCCSTPIQSIFRSQLIWINAVCKGRVYPGSAGQGLIHNHWII